LGIKPGPEVGKEVQKIETNNFKKLLGISWFLFCFTLYLLHIFNVWQNI
jgi:hypothetical protein